mgnify:CR=1 FL=1
MRRASKRQSTDDVPTPLYSEQTRDRRLGRSPTKVPRPLDPAQTDAPAGAVTPVPAADPEAPTADAHPADKPQEVLFINRSGSKVRKNQGQGRQGICPPRPNQGKENEVYFRCQENVDLPAVNKARDVFIPIELHFRKDRALTELELEKACVTDKKVLFLYWNHSFQAKRKVQGVHHWFQHNRRRDSGFPFVPGPAACIRVPKNVHVQVRAGCRLGAVVAVVDAGLDRLPKEPQDEEDLSRTNPPCQPPVTRRGTHSNSYPDGTGYEPGPQSISASSAYYSL